MSGNYKFDTLTLHAGQVADKSTGARAVPIYQTTSYVFQDTEHAASLFNMEVGGHIYSRLTNPTIATLEQRVAALEGGVACVAVSSGMAALFLTVLSLASQGDHIVASSQMYGASINLFEHTLPRYGITTTFDKLLWNAATVIFPSPRQKDFQRCMKMAVKMIETGALDISGFWSKGYERETEWQDAFKEGNQRMPGYNRGYIEWL